MSGMLIDTLAYQWIGDWPHRDKSYLYHDYLVRDFMLYLLARAGQRVVCIQERKLSNGGGSRLRNGAQRHQSRNQ